VTLLHTQSQCLQHSHNNLPIYSHHLDRPPPLTLSNKNTPPAMQRFTQTIAQGSRSLSSTSKASVSQSSKAASSSPSARPSTSGTFTSNPRFFDSLSKRNSPDTQHYNLTDKPSVRFTIRPAPSVVPPQQPIPSSSSSNDAILPPPIHPPRSTSASTNPLSPEQMSEIRELRLQDPATWTRSKLAARYGCSKFFIGLLGFGESTQARQTARLVREVHEGREERRRQHWGLRKRIDREVRRRRKELW